MRNTVKVALGTFTCKGIEANLGSDVAGAARTALAEYVRRLSSSEALPIALPPVFCESHADPKICLDLTVDADTWVALEREAARQDVTVSQIAAHSLLVYLAEVDRLAAPPSATTA